MSTIPIIPLSPPIADLRQVPIIPIDILHETLIHLPFRDRLSFSVISRSIHAVLPPRLTRLVIRDFNQLASLAKYISDHPISMLSLRSLHLLIERRFPWETKSYEDGKENSLYALRNAPHLEELVCRGTASTDLIPDTLATYRRLTHVELRGFPRILTGAEPSKQFFPSTLRSIHFTGRDHFSNFHRLDRMLQLVSHITSLETFIVENYASASSLRNKERRAQSENDHVLVIPSVRTLKFVRCSDFDFEFVSEIRKRFPNFTTLHLDRTPFQRRPPEYSVDHLVLTDIPPADELDHYGRPGPIPWKARRLTYTHEVTSDHYEFSIPCCQVDVGSVLCLTIRARVIAEWIWADLIAHARAVRLLELESSLTTFAQLVTWLIERTPPDTPADVALTCISISARELGYLWDSPPGNWERTRDEVLQMASMYFPALHYVAIATPKRPAYMAPAPLFPGDDTQVWTWWRVHRDGDGKVVGIREIPAWEGRQVREFLQNADAEAMKTFDQTFVALC